jgi:DNA-binding NarL/FixJ family response regulator
LIATCNLARAGGSAYGHRVPQMKLECELKARRALQAGVFCYLIKPFDEDELLACIRSALEQNKVDMRGQRS